MDNLFIPIVSLVGILGLAIGSLIVKATGKQTTPIGSIIERAKENFVTPESVDKVVDNLLLRLGVPVPFVDWASTIIVKLITGVPAFHNASQEHIKSVVASQYSKLNPTQAGVLVPGLPPAITAEPYAKKRVASTILKQVDLKAIPAVKAMLK